MKIYILLIIIGLSLLTSYWFCQSSLWSFYNKERSLEDMMLVSNFLYKSNISIYSDINYDSDWSEVSFIKYRDEIWKTIRVRENIRYDKCIKIQYYDKCVQANLFEKKGRWYINFFWRSDRVWMIYYDIKLNYLIIQLWNKFYHYCNIPINNILEGIYQTNNILEFYENNIYKKYDCKKLLIPDFEKIEKQKLIKEINEDSKWIKLLSSILFIISSLFPTIDMLLEKKIIKKKIRTVLWLLFFFILWNLLPYMKLLRL